MPAEKKPRLRWRRQPDRTGLASIGQTARGAELRDGEAILGAVYSHYPGSHLTRPQDGWYWVARDDERGIPLRNTVGQKGGIYPVADFERAKADCESYVRECMGLTAKKAKK